MISGTEKRRLAGYQRLAEEHLPPPFQSPATVRPRTHPVDANAHACQHPAPLRVPLLL
jgi:hypothetical protein